MTEEQFNKAIELHDTLNSLYRVKKEIEGTIKHRLCYIEHCDREFGYADSDWKISNIRTLAVIGHIFDRHDKQIRQEIEDEINQIKQEIEKL